MSSELVSIKQGGDKSASGMEVGYENPGLNLEKAENIKNYWNRLERIKKFSKIFFLFLLIKFLISIAIIVFACVLYFKFSSIIIRLVLSIASVCAAVFIFGGIVFKMYFNNIKECIQKKDKFDPNEVDQTGTRSAINIFLYLLLAMFYLLLILGVGCFVYRDEVLGEIEAYSMDRNSWTQHFGNYSYEFILNDATMYLNIVAGIMIILSAIIGLFLIFSFYLLNLFSNCRTVTIFICGIFFKSGLLVLYTCLYSAIFSDLAYIYKDIYMFYYFIFGAIGITIMAISLFGFIVALLKKRTLIYIIFIFSICLSVMVAIMAIVGFWFLSDKIRYFDHKCNLLLEPFAEKYLVNGIGCDSKYLFRSDLLETMICPKERIISVFEYPSENSDPMSPNNASGYEYGCLSQTCCYLTYSFIKQKFDYLILCTFAAFLINWFLIIAFGRLTFTLTSREEPKTFEKPFICFISILCFIFALGGLLLVELIPLKADLNPDLFIKVNATDPNVLDKKATIAYVIPTIDDYFVNTANEIKNIETEINTAYENLNKASTTDKYEYVYSFAQPNGDINYDQAVFEKYKLSLITFNQTNNFTFSTEQWNSNLISELIKLYPNCPSQLATINIKVNQISLDNKSNNSPIYQNNIIYYSPSTAQQTVEGVIQQITYDNTNLTYSLMTNLEVKVFSYYFPKCEILTYQTNSSGAFTTDKINLPYNNYSTDYVVSVVSMGAEVVRFPFKLGGLGWQSVINLGKLTYWTEQTNSLGYAISSTVKNSTDFLPLENVYIYMFNGSVQLMNEYSSNPSIWNLLQEIDSGDMKQTYTNQEGKFKFTNVTSDKYTLVYFKEGYYLEYSYIDVIANQGESEIRVQSPLLIPLVKTESDFAVVLTWKSDMPEDLDIHTDVNMKDGKLCEIFFGNTHCVGVSLLNDTTNGSEIMSISPLGKYIYTFFVERFVDLSVNEIVPGENPVQINQTISSFSNITQSNQNSLVKIQLYSYGYLYSVYQIQIPLNSFIQNRWWTVFCLDGSKGISSIKTVDELSNFRSERIDNCQ